MTDRKTGFTRSRAFLLGVTCVAASLVISGCTEFRRSIGMERTAPDEFAVESRAPLTIPPDYDLRPPQPGAPRPQEARPGDVARRAIDNASAGEPGKQAQATPNLSGNVGGAARPDPSSQVGDQSLSGKLLGSSETTSSTVEKRETTPVKGVY